VWQAAGCDALRRRIVHPAAVVSTRAAVVVAPPRRPPLRRSRHSTGHTRLVRTAATWGKALTRTRPPARVTKPDISHQR
jgi:hypothetical protein